MQKRKSYVKLCSGTASQAFEVVCGLIVSGGDSMNDGEFIEHRLGIVRQNLSVFDDPFDIDLITASHESPPPMSATLHTTSAAYTAAGRVS